MISIIMKKRNNYFKLVHWVFVCVFILTACSKNCSPEERIYVEDDNAESEAETEKAGVKPGNASTESDAEDIAESRAIEPDITYADWSGYFNGLNGTAVIYDVSHKRYTMYNSDLALTRSSPCSTFKIISSLIALENGIFEPEDSIRKWSGEIFWNEDFLLCNRRLKKIVI